MHVLWIAVVIIIIDQVTKLAVLQNMYVGQSIPLVGDWLKFTFTENPGMAFGITVGPQGFVSILSITATLLISYYLYRVRHSYSWYRMSIGCILGGALGNIIDRVFYGMFFYHNGLFTGHVVDFIHVNIWRGYIPDGWPVIGGKYAALFPIWNVADMAIVLGVIGILVFQNKFQESLLGAAGVLNPEASTSFGEDSQETDGSNTDGSDTDALASDEVVEAQEADVSTDVREDTPASDHEAGDKLPQPPVNREPTVGE